MKAIVFERYGAPSVLKIKETEKPTPGDNEVLIKVYASTVTLYDCWARSSTAPPGFWLPSRLGSGILKPNQPILGTDVAGEIVAIGRDVTRLKVGDQVFGTALKLGAHAQYACLIEEGVGIKPSNMSYEEAAAVVQGALTALYFLKKAEIKAGQKVLIFGASGGVGLHAVQLAKHFGAEVTGVCSTAKVAFVKSLGADRIIDYKKSDFTKEGETYDIVFDTVGKTKVSPTIKTLNENGRYVMATFGLPMLIKVLWLLRKSSKKAVFGVIAENFEDMIFLRELVEAGELRAMIDRTFPMEQVVEAHRYVESGKKQGSVVLTIPHSD